MRTLSIIPEDRAIVVDGSGLFLDFEIDSAIHAVQWNEEEGQGHIEYKDGRGNEMINNIAQFQSIIDLYNIQTATTAEQQRLQEEADVIEQAEREAFEQTYIYLRQQAYPLIGDQLDMLWHSMDTGEIPKSVEFYDTLKVVKDEYPKPEEG